MLSIIKDGIEPWSYKLPRGTHLLVSNKKYVEYEEILCFNCIRSASLLSLASGYFFFKNLNVLLKHKERNLWYNWKNL